jgi:hypothetical protein
MRLFFKFSIILFFGFTGIFSRLAFGTISNVNYGGASFVLQGSTSTTTSTSDIVYGGVAGSASTCTGTDVCDNCHGPIKPCNARRITPNTNFIVVLKTDNKDAVKVGSKILLQIGSGTSYLSPNSATETLAVNTELTATFSWGNLCKLTELGGKADCSGADKADVTAKIGFDSNNDSTFNDGEEVYTFKISLVGNYINDSTDPTYSYHSALCGQTPPAPKTNDGFCHFTLYKGDQKIYIENEVVAETYNKTATSGIDFAAVRFYYEQAACANAASFDAITLDSPNHTTAITASGDSFLLNDGFVPNLENYKNYIFRMANIDQAGNVFLFSPSSTTAGGSVDYLNCTQHSAAPEEVMGLVESNGCFIATAAYGTTMAKEIDVLREFRSKILLKSSLGRVLTKIYYTYSPDLALKLKKNPLARTLVRYTLWPIVNFAKFVLWSPMLALSLLTSLGLLLITSLYFVFVNKRRERIR